MLRLVERITEAVCQGKQTTVFFLYVKKAFDRVWEEGVLCKLTEAVLPDCYVRFLRTVAFCETVASE